FVFVPLTTLAMATLPQREIGNASGVYNLMRNTGGSVGIAIMTTLLARNQQFHQAVLMANINEYNPAFQQTFNQLKSTFMLQTDAVTATQQAYQAIYGMVSQQAAVLAYIDDFWILALLCFLCVPAGFLFQRV